MSLDWPDDIGSDDVFRYAKYYLRHSGWTMHTAWDWVGVLIRATKDGQHLNLMSANPNSASLNQITFDASDNAVKLNAMITVLVHGLAAPEVPNAVPPRDVCFMRPKDLPDAVETLRALSNARRFDDNVGLDEHPEESENGRLVQESGHETAPAEAIGPTEDLPAPTIKGMVGRISSTRVWGWAYSPERPDWHLLVEVTAQGHLLGAGAADLFRGNLQEAGIGAGDHAFDIQIDMEGMDVALEEIIVVGVSPAGARAALRVATHALQLPASRGFEETPRPGAGSDEH